jgi:RsmE family RNA methyltransferase
MNLIVFEDNDLIGENILRLQNQRFLQIKETHRSTVGDSVRVGQLNGLMGKGIIQSIDEQSVELNVSLDQAPPEKLPLTIVLALPRPKMIRRIFRSCAELGIQRLIVINSYKVEKSFWGSPAIEEHNVRQYLIEGLQQARDTVLPTVEFHQRFKPFVEDTLPDIIKGTLGLVAHPQQGKPCPHQLDKAITLAIGPEGGFTPYEVEKLIEADCEAIHLGERILKVENAVSTLVAKLYS